MRKHTVIGERIIASAPALAPVARLVRSSHGRWDGNGYPDGLHRAEQIPLGSRVVAVCDAYDAMTSDRPYGEPRFRAEALAELRRCAGAQFNPAVVAAFERAFANRGEGVAALVGRAQRCDGGGARGWAGTSFCTSIQTLTRSPGCRAGKPRRRARTRRPLS